MNIDQLQELKRKLTNDADLSDIWLFYMDHFADLPEFTDLGEPAYNEYLDAVLQKTCQQMFDRAIKISDCLLSTSLRIIYFMELSKFKDVLGV